MAVQIWLLVACLGTVLGATGETFHLFSWSKIPQQQLMNAIAADPALQTILSSPGGHISPTVTPMSTTVPTPTITPMSTTVPTPTIASTLAIVPTPATVPTPTTAPTPTIAPTPTMIPTQQPSGSTTANPAVLDAGFEIPSLGHGKYQYRPAGSYWTFSGNAGIAANGSLLTYNNPDAPQGMQVAFLNKIGSFEQKINFASGSYYVSFYAAQRYKKRQDFQVLIDGYVIGTFIPSSIKYTLQSTNSFTVTAGEHVLSFQGLNSQGENNTAFIDAVAINAQSGTS